MVYYKTILEAAKHFEEKKDQIVENLKRVMQ